MQIIEKARMLNIYMDKYTGYSYDNENEEE